MTKFEHLQKAILELSQSPHWNEACQEWSLTGVFFNEATQSCLCTHSPIVEVCDLTNRLTGATAEVGNCCVKRFLNLPSGTIFDAIKRIQLDPARALNEEAIILFHAKEFINDWERSFYLSTYRKRSLTGKQGEIRVRINKRVLACLKAENQRKKQ